MGPINPRNKAHDLYNSFKKDHPLLSSSEIIKLVLKCVNETLLSLVKLEILVISLIKRKTISPILTTPVSEEIHFWNEVKLELENYKIICTFEIK